jgi:hypothetical protein
VRQDAVPGAGNRARALQGAQDHRLPRPCCVDIEQEVAERSRERENSAAQRQGAAPRNVHSAACPDGRHAAVKARGGWAKGRARPLIGPPRRLGAKPAGPGIAALRVDRSLLASDSAAAAVESRSSCLIGNMSKPLRRAGFIRPSSSCLALADRTEWGRPPGLRPGRPANRHLVSPCSEFEPKIGRPHRDRRGKHVPILT